MFENLALIASLALIVWIISFAVYGYSFRQQKELEGDMKTLRDRLDRP